MKKILFKKGYTLEVVSWENDGDNYKTKYYTVDTKEKALGIKHMCDNLFQSDTGVGNSFDDENPEETIKEYFEEHPFLVNANNLDNLYDYTSDLAYELMGGSECYMFRVCEKCTILYSDKDIELEIIEV